MKKQLREFSRNLLAVLLAILSLIACCSCEKEVDLCENKICIECADTATHYTSGAKPVNGKANEDNCEEISSMVYRIFYCDECWNAIPKAEIKP